MFCYSPCKCVHLYDLVDVMCWNIKSIRVHGVFPFVIVWVWHGEPGNLHPCNSNAQITYLPHYHHDLQFLSQNFSAPLN